MKESKKFSIEHRQKLSETKQGEKNPMWGKDFSPEHRRKLSVAKQGKRHPNWGKKFSPEYCQKLSDAHKGKKFSSETRQKMSDAQQGEKNHNWGKRGKEAPNWKGGRTKRFEYISLRVPNHPNADCHGYILEHRLIMEEMLGRPLIKEEIVHHINGNPADNRKENLMLFPSCGGHAKYHAQLRRR